MKQPAESQLIIRILIFAIQSQTIIHKSNFSCKKGGTNSVSLSIFNPQPVPVCFTKFYKGLLKTFWFWKHCVETTEYFCFIWYWSIFAQMILSIYSKCQLNSYDIFDSTQLTVLHSICSTHIIRVTLLNKNLDLNFYQILQFQKHFNINLTLLK